MTEAGRVEVYVHSDTVTENKGATVVRITTQTDFAARTDIFKAFCKRVAMLAYATGTTNWVQLEETVFGEELTKLRDGAENKLGETFSITYIETVTL